MKYYLTLDCEECGEEVHQGVNVTYLEHKGLPAIPFDIGALTKFHCDNCGHDNYTGEIEIFDEDDL